MDRTNNFDFIRFILAFTLIIKHTIILSGHAAFSEVHYFLNTPYTIRGFFIISGCLITNSYLRTSTFRRYVEKRARRLLPTYIFVIFLCAIGLSFVSTLPLQAYFTSPILAKYLAANLTFMNFIQPSLPGVFEHAPNIMSAVNGSLWTIKIEVMFYFVLPILVFLLGEKESSKLRKLFGLTAIYIFGVAWRAYFELKSEYNPMADLLRAQMPGFLNYFAAGMALLYFNDFFNKNKNILAFIALVVFSIETYLQVEYFKAIAFATLIYYVAFSFKFLNSFGKYGELSYGMYLFHFPVIQLLVSFYLFELINPWLALALVLCITLTCARFSWKYIENPFLAKKR